MAQMEEKETDGDTDDDRSVETTKSTNSRSGESRKSRGSNTTGWSGFQGVTSETEVLPVYKQRDNSIRSFNDLKHVFLLDSGSTIGGTIMNADFVTDVKPSKSPIGMRTNTGGKSLTVEAKVPGFGKVWYDPEQMANIFGLSKLVKQYRVTFDSAIDNSFHVHTNDGVIDFSCTEEGLYAYRPTENFLKMVAKEKGMMPPRRP